MVVHSDNFMENLEEFFGNALFINHINFSGMNFDQTNMWKLLEMIRKCQFMLGVHLSDNNIASSYGSNDFFDCCLAEFFIG